MPMPMAVTVPSVLYATGEAALGTPTEIQPQIIYIYQYGFR